MEDARVGMITYEEYIADQGIKIFKGDGYKLPDEVENQIEAHVFNNCTDIRLAEGADIGRIKMCRTGVKDYVDFLQEHIDADLTGLKVLFDCANGASARVAQELFPRLGCECGFIGTQQDGVSVNDGCGSTHLETLEAAVKQGGYDCGIAFDGDADRCLACDENGAEIDGDKIIALVGTDMKERGRLDGNTVVVTVMSNLGFMKYMHIARSLVAHGYVKTVDEAFDTYIGSFGQRLAYVESELDYAPIEDVLSALQKAQGIAILAHLFFYPLDEAEQHRLLHTFQSLAGPCSGMEVYYGRYTDEQRCHLAALAAQYDLLPSAGSDFHGPGDGNATHDGGLGHHFPASVYEALEARQREVYGVVHD